MEETKDMIEKNAPQQENVERTQEKEAEKTILNYGGKTDFILMAGSIICLICCQFLPWSFVNWIATASGLMAVLLPLVARALYRSRSFSLQLVVDTLKDAGLNPTVVDDAVHWCSNGRKNIIRVYNGSVLQLSREYPLEKKINLDMNAKAALATTNEICSVKVGVRWENEDKGCLVFASESLCPSGRVFKQVYSVYLQALDAAEQRQGENLREVATREDRPKRKIGFIIGDNN
ncbi:MAG: hypothetical protein J6R30_04790 [Bacteroidales bacterium]|nr:hypothetical protein [Bacteroidales bacterium]